ncbi:Protein SufA [Buchnera aphidicola (Cinara kochiana kochiana)]|uniref:Protein SufA n=1 Tax=Buchnera aphidicola (Cinara kochiana kochiana) TaxID=2518976 RepID=A0A451D579_9GAMM|nr:iron-sulfur cluster assembly accessory protein [Buchnera aphidicola]VFP81001.1 Protein SufA [Buchnera aphidicola (Cinara kochiana kochiana)]
MNIIPIKKINQSIPIQVTKKAAQQILLLLKQDKNNQGIKIILKKSGCAGYKYLLQTEKKIKNSDYIFIVESIKFIIPKKIISQLYTTTIDFIQIGLNASFTFINNKHTAICGCGESFNI